MLETPSHERNLAAFSQDRGKAGDLPTASDALEPLEVDALTGYAIVKAGAQIIDVREIEEWEEGHDPTALHIPLGQFSNRIMQEIPICRELVIYCRSGARSLKAAQIAQQAGYRAYSVPGGITAWQEAARTEENEPGINQYSSNPFPCAVPESLLANTPTQCLINGKWIDATGGQTFVVENPATGQPLTRVASSTSQDALIALENACAVQEQWGETNPSERADILYRTWHIVNRHRRELATLMVIEMGKPITQAYGEVEYAARYLRWYAQSAERLTGSWYQAPEGNLEIFTRPRPIGPCLLITPWNFPLAMAARKVAPALAAGCTVILKPAKLTPLTSLYFGKLLLEAGVPAGVLQILPTDQASEVSIPLLEDPRLRKLSFTGSTVVGRQLMALAAPNVVRTSMEIGGNAPFIILEDADLDAAVAGAVEAKMRNMGQACTAANRILVHESLYSEFIVKLKAALTALVENGGLGDPQDPRTEIGPLISDAAVAHLNSLMDDAKARGGQIWQVPINSSMEIQANKRYFTPTLLLDINTDAQVFNTEIFGPLVGVFSFKTESEAITLANQTEYGLAAYVYTRDFRRFSQFGKRLHFGLLGFNSALISNAAAPFGGVKQSGLGKEGGFSGINEYLDLQYVGMR